MGEIKLHEAPTISVIANGIKFTPRFPAMPRAIGNINAAEATFGSVLNVTLYALIDGAIGGLVFAWLYNLLVARFGK